jgi:putative phosphoesterase
MRVAVLNDIHGNAAALDAVLAEPDVQSADRVVIGGDFVGGPQPVEVLQRLRDVGSRALLLRGNGEREVLEAVLPAPGVDDAVHDPTGAAWVRGWLDVRDIPKLAELPLVIELDGVLYCHATPTSDSDIFTHLSSDEAVRDLVAPVREGLLIVGHTHSQYDRTIGDLRIVNAGSVGMPYEGTPGARWALVDAPQVYLRTTAYDVEATIARFEASPSPAATQHAQFLRTNPTADEASAHFEGLVAAGHNAR